MAVDDDWRNTTDVVLKVFFWAGVWGEPTKRGEILQAYLSLSFLFLTNEKYIEQLSFVKV